MIKRILALFLALTAMLTVPILRVQAADTVLKVIPPSELPKAGETFEVAVELSGNPGFNVLSFSLAFNHAELDCQECMVGPVLQDTLHVVNPDAEEGIRIASAVVDPVEMDGTVIVARFLAKTDISKWALRIENLMIGDADGNELPSQVEGNAEIDALETAEPAFPDTVGHWADAYIKQVVKEGLFKGYANGLFLPDENVSRGQFVTVLYRMCGSPAVSTKPTFEDIGDQIEEFQRAIAWAASKGYVNGRSETVFDPGGNVTRQEAMKILFMLAGSVSGMETLFSGTYDTYFVDSDAIAAWALKAMYWGVYKGLISGTGDHELNPTGFASRAQLAKILANYMEKYPMGDSVS